MGRPLLAGLLVSLLLMAGPGAAAEPAELVQHVTGNGNLTVGLDEAGRLRQLRWPGPASSDHLSPLPAANAADAPGAGWMVFEGVRWVPLDHPGWKIRQGYTAADSVVVATRFEEPEGRRSAVQRVFVCPGMDVLVVQLRLQGFEAGARIAWYQNLSPMTVEMARPRSFERPVVPEGDFAAWYNEADQILTHFRPSAPDRAAWSTARALADGQDAAYGWTSFESGTYSCTASPNTIVRAIVASESSGLWNDVDQPDTGAAYQAVGRVQALLELATDPVGDDQNVTVFLGWGSESSASRAAIDRARRQGPAELLSMASRAGPEWLRGGRNMPADGIVDRSILNLLLCLDQTTGAVVLSPASHPVLARISVFEAVWATAALNHLGYTDSAARALDFLLNAVRETRHGTPAGSLPASVWPDGTTVAPLGHVESASAAWLLAGIWRHTMTLPEGGRSAYLDEIWPKLVLCGDFLARDPVVGRALSGRGPSEETDLSMLEEHYLGLESLRRIAARADRPEATQWTDRRNELYARIRIRQMNDADIAGGTVPWARCWVGTLSGLDESAHAGWDLLADENAPLPEPEGRMGRDGGIIAGEVPHALRDAIRCLAAERRFSPGN